MALEDGHVYGLSRSPQSKENGEAWLPADLLSSPARNGDFLKHHQQQQQQQQKFVFPFEFPYEPSYMPAMDPYSEFAAIARSREEMVLLDEDDFIVGLAEQIARSSLNDVDHADAKRRGYEANRGAGWACREKKLPSSLWPNEPLKRMAPSLPVSPTSTLAADICWGSTHPKVSAHLPSPRLEKSHKLHGHGEDAWDLLQAAANEVARLRESRRPSIAYYYADQHLAWTGSPAPPQLPMATTWNVPSLPEYAQASVATRRCREENRLYGGSQIRVDSYCVQQSRSLNGSCQHAAGLSQDVAKVASRQPGWPRDVSPPQWVSSQSAAPVPAVRSMPAGSVNNSGFRRQSGGTGVFLPRRYSGGASDNSSRKKIGSSTVLPACIVQALKSNPAPEDSQPPSQPSVSNGYYRSRIQSQDENTLLVPRPPAAVDIMPTYSDEQILWNNNSRQSSPLETLLPAEWTY